MNIKQHKLPHATTSAYRYMYRCMIDDTSKFKYLSKCFVLNYNFNLNLLLLKFKFTISNWYIYIII